MPIVVDEVLITVEVENEGAGAPAGTAAPGAGRAAGASADRQALVAECVERVLEVLAERREP
jgi:hypothetical protein